MFTGIITNIGTINDIITNDMGDITLNIASNYDMESVNIGASIACNGVCLTVVKKQNIDGLGYFTMDASLETINITTINTWAKGDFINLECALCLGDELGGHLVSGHIDCTAIIDEKVKDGDSWRFSFACPSKVMKYIACKGSVVINGVSLTVNEVKDDNFSVNIIPHTMEHTIFGKNSINDKVNLEVDLLSRYVARLLGKE